jgi:hypothetical protein
MRRTAGSSSIRRILCLIRSGQKNTLWPVAGVSRATGSGGSPQILFSVTGFSVSREPARCFSLDLTEAINLLSEMRAMHFSLQQSLIYWDFRESRGEQPSAIGKWLAKGGKEVTSRATPDRAALKRLPQKFGGSVAAKVNEMTEYPQWITGSVDDLICRLVNRTGNHLFFLAIQKSIARRAEIALQHPQNMGRN